MLDHPTICIIGSGAVGGYYGARLAQHGNAVHFLLRSDYDAVRAHGFDIKSCDGDFKVDPRTIGVARDARQMPGADLVLVTLKTTANDEFSALIGPLIKDDTAILTLQNGLGNEERLAELFGAERVLGGMAFTCINRLAPGVIHHIAEGWIRIGEFGGGPSARAARIAEIFKQSKIDCTVLDDLQRGRWEKLTWNVPFNGLGAILDRTTDRLIDSEAGVELVMAVIEELVAGAAALGVKLPADIAGKQVDKTLPMGPYLSSMQIDRREKRPMEIEAILGAPLRQAMAAGAMMPKLQMLYDLARVVAAGY